MKHVVFSNKEYLTMFLESSKDLSERVLLPHESVAVDNAVNEQRLAYDGIIEAKIKVSGGDDWHDGAFRATDNEAKIISQQMSAISPYIGAPIVDYPEADERRVTLGSRIGVTQAGYSFPVDIVGFRAGYPQNIVSSDFDEEVIGMSPESPLACLILGQEVGFEAVLINGNREIPVRVDVIDQSAVREFFMRDVQIIHITD